MLVIDGEIAIIELPRKGAITREDFPHSLVVRGEKAEYYNAIFMIYWHLSSDLTRDALLELKGESHNA
jgi:hypothetical protein